MSQKMMMQVKKKKQMKKNYQIRYLKEMSLLSSKISIKFSKEKILTILGKLMVSENKKKKY